VNAIRDMTLATHQFTGTSFGIPHLQEREYLLDL